MKALSVSLIALLLVIACTTTQAPNAESIQHKADQVAQWQLDHMDNFDYIRTFVDHTEAPTGWVQAAFYIGLNRWYEATQNPVFRQALIDKAKANRWQLGPLPWHADDQAFAQVYLALADDTPAADITPTQSAFDKIIAANHEDSLEFIRDETGTAEGTCQKRWCWSDALFMAPPAWAALSRITGEERHLDYALREFKATTDYLFDPDDHLYYRDSRFFDRKSAYGNKVFWSRGNGWVFAGLPLLLEQMPENHPQWGELIEQFRKMAYAFKDLQADTGLWASSLMDYAHQPLAETSGSSFILFGLAWGINRQLLPQADFLPTVEKGWRAVNAKVSPEGRLGWVQQVGNAPDQVLASDTQLDGTGAYLLAASELIHTFN